MFSSAINAIMVPFLDMSPLLSILIISFVLSLIIILSYKFLTDQKLMKKLKEEIKVMQKEMKELRNNPKKMMEVQKKAMEKNMKYMAHSMKPTLFTMLPLLLVFGWMSAHFSYYPIMPNESFNVSLILSNDYKGTVNVEVTNGLKMISNHSTTEYKKNTPFRVEIFTFKGSEGKHIITFSAANRTYTKEVLITTKQAYSTPQEKIKEGPASEIRIQMRKMKLLNIFGWKMGWIGTYIILSLVFSIVMRKLFRIY